MKPQQPFPEKKRKLPPSKKYKAKRMYEIEYRVVKNGIPSMWKRSYGRKYRTEKQRDQAVDKLNNAWRNYGMSRMYRYEHRAKP